MLGSVSMNPPSENWSTERIIPSRAEDAISLITEMVDQLRQRQWEEHDLFGIHLALEEAIMNAIKHGNAGDPAKQVDVRCELSGAHFEITVEDQGSGFHRSEVPDPTDEDNLEKESGRGLMLMEFYMSEVHYNEVGNRVRMVKTRGEEPSLSPGEQDDED